MLAGGIIADVYLWIPYILQVYGKIDDVLPLSPLRLWYHHHLGKTEVISAISQLLSYPIAQLQGMHGFKDFLESRTCMSC